MSANRVAVALAALVGLVPALAWVWSAHGALVAAEARTGASMYEIEYTIAAGADRDGFDQEVADMRSMLATLEQRLPARTDVAAWERALRTQAASLGVDVTSVGAAAESVRDFYTETPLQLRVRGPNEAVYALLADLGQATPVSHVTAFELVPAGDARDVLEALVDVRLFGYVADEETP